MKIYRFMYKNKKVKVDEFECSEIVNYGYNIEKYYSGYGGKVISYEHIKEIRHSNNYIMWSLSKDSINDFLDQIIDIKKSQITPLVRQIKTYKREIEELEKEKVVYNEK